MSACSRAKAERPICSFRKRSHHLQFSCKEEREKKKRLGDSAVDKYKEATHRLEHLYRLTLCSRTVPSYQLR